MRFAAFTHERAYPAVLGMAHASRNRHLSSTIAGTRRRDVANTLSTVQAAATSRSVIDVFALALDSLLACATCETRAIRLTAPCLGAGAIQITESRFITLVPILVPDRKYNREGVCRTGKSREH